MKVICNYCSAYADLVDSAVVYHGQSFGMIWLCPQCGAFVGCHPDNSPLGTLANQELRDARKAAHAKFDKLWQDGTMTRKEAYVWMQKTMNMNERQAHIANFNLFQCGQLVKKLAAITP